MPSGDGVRSRHQLMADSMSVMCRAATALAGRGGEDSAAARPGGAGRGGCRRTTQGALAGAGTGIGVGAGAGGGAVRSARNRGRRFADHAAAFDAAGGGDALVRAERADDARQAVGLVLGRQDVAAVGGVGDRRAAVVELALLLLVERRAGFLQAGGPVLGGVAGFAVRSFLQVERLGIVGRHRLAGERRACGEGGCDGEHRRADGCGIRKHVRSSWSPWLSCR